MWRRASAWLPSWLQTITRQCRVSQLPGSISRMRRNVLSPSENRPAWHSANARSNNAATSFGSLIAADVDMGAFHRSELRWGRSLWKSGRLTLRCSRRAFNLENPENCPAAPGSAATPFDALLETWLRAALRSAIDFGARGRIRVLRSLRVYSGIRESSKTHVVPGRGLRVGVPRQGYVWVADTGVPSPRSGWRRPRAAAAGRAAASGASARPGAGNLRRPRPRPSRLHGGASHAGAHPYRQGRLPARARLPGSSRDARPAELGDAHRAERGLLA